MRIALCIAGYSPQNNGYDACRKLAQAVEKNATVDILTSCAIDPETWREVMPAGEFVQDSHKIIRFRPDFPRTSSIQRRIADAIIAGLSCPELDERWLYETGPVSSELRRYLETNVYDAAVVFGLTNHWSVSCGRHFGPQTIVCPCEGISTWTGLSVVQSLFTNSTVWWFNSEGQEAEFCPYLTPKPRRVIGQIGAELPLSTLDAVVSEIVQVAGK